MRIEHQAEFMARAGRYLKDAAKGPVFITQDNRPIRVFLDIDTYNRLKAHDTCRSMSIEELGPELKNAIASANVDRIDRELGNLID